VGLPIIDLGRMGYGPAYERQLREHARVLEQRARGEPVPGVVLLVEHDPVITVSKRPSARANLVATPEMLDAHGVAVEPTDRGGDITYHGPGQLVVYPILDLNYLGVRLHDYLRALEHAVEDTCRRFGVVARRDPDATGVWIDPADNPDPGEFPFDRPAKVCAIGVRVRRWITLHGLALNVTTNLRHFELIVPCGLAGRPVTSLEQVLGAECPDMHEVKQALVATLASSVRSVARESRLP